MQTDIPIQTSPPETTVTAALRLVAHLAGGVVRYTTNGEHADGSLHYVGRAVDIALPSGATTDSPALGALVPRLLALVPIQFISELIWAGPGATYIKNGKHVAPYAAAEHHNHIHLAATTTFTYHAPETPMPDAMPDYAVNAAPISISITPSGNGYIILCADGGVFCFGDAKYLGRVHKA